MYQQANKKEIQEHIMVQFGLSADQVETLLLQFIEAIAGHQEDFEKAVSDGDKNSIAKAAHKYKGALANLGVKDGAELTLAAETAAKKRDAGFNYDNTASSLKEIISPLFQ